MIPETISHYRILKRLGAGGMGEVYLAEDTLLERKVALKVLPAEFTHSAERLRRFVKEAKAASALNHPNILTIYEIGCVDGLHFIATEYIDGVTLRHWLQQQRPRLAEALDIAVQVAGALTAAHENGIVHRDIKPANIMVRRDGYVKVLDFGLVKLIERIPAGIDTKASTVPPADTHPGMVMGTVQYMSPEQARGLEVDVRTDIFSLGVVLYEMAAGCAPFEGATSSDVLAALLQSDPPPLARFSRELPELLEWIVAKALAKDRAERYQTIRDLNLDLRKLKHRLEIQTEIGRSSGDIAATPAVTPEVKPAVAVAVPFPVEVAEMPRTDKRAAAAAQKVALLYKRNAQPDENLLKSIETSLAAAGYQVFVDRHLTIGIEWAQEIERQVRTSDAVIPLLSGSSIGSEMLAYEVQIAHEAAQKQQGKRPACCRCVSVTKGRCRSRWRPSWTPFITRFETVPRMTRGSSPNWCAPWKPPRRRRRFPWPGWSRRAARCLWIPSSILYGRRTRISWPPSRGRTASCW